MLGTVGNPLFTLGRRYVTFLSKRSGPGGLGWRDGTQVDRIRKYGNGRHARRRASQPGPEPGLRLGDAASHRRLLSARPRQRYARLLPAGSLGTRLAALAGGDHRHPGAGLAMDVHRPARHFSARASSPGREIAGHAAAARSAGHGLHPADLHAARARADGLGVQLRLVDHELCGQPDGGVDAELSRPLVQRDAGGAAAGDGRTVCTREAPPVPVRGARAAGDPAAISLAAGDRSVRAVHRVSAGARAGRRRCWRAPSRSSRPTG
jgi:hypothetical protein